MTEPTREQLDNLLDRATDHQLTLAEVDRLRAGLAGLRADANLGWRQAETRSKEADEWAESCRQFKAWGEGLAAAVQRVRDLVADMPSWCTPRHIGVDYADRIRAALDRPDITVLRPTGINTIGLFGAINIPLPMTAEEYAGIEAMGERIAEQIKAAMAGLYAEPVPADMRGISPDSLPTSVDEAVPAADSEPARPDRTTHDPRWGNNPDNPCYRHLHDTCATEWCTCGCHRGEPEVPDDHPGWLHARCAHPGWEYATTTGQRKAWDNQNTPPEGDGWERNLDRALGWERFEYLEESYWRRPRPVESAPLIDHRPKEQA